MKITLSQKAFRQFLVEHPKTRFSQADAAKCPVAKFIQSQIPTDHIVGIDYVNDIQIYQKNVQEPVKMVRRPAWIMAFVKAFDCYAFHERARWATGTDVLKFYDSLG